MGAPHGDVRIVIHMKSGAAIEVLVEKFTTTKNGFGELTGFKYEGGNVNLMFLRLDDVVAVVEHIDWSAS